MSEITIEVSAIIEASPKDVYSVLADYLVGHRAILPKEYFTDLAVIQGGQGADTVIDVKMNVMGVERDYQFKVSEPEPGRILMEADEDAGVVTTFTVDPVGGEIQSCVTINTRVKTSRGLRGLVERLINPPITRRIYRQELQHLTSYMAARTDESG